MHREPTKGDAVLVHYGELGLKGRNQPLFRRQLRENIALKLKALGLGWKVEDRPGLLAINVPPDEVGKPLEPVLRALRQVFGIVWFARARQLPHHGFVGEAQAADFADLERELISVANARYAVGRTFAVRVNRADKAVPFTSVELEARLGRLIRQSTEWDKVDLRQPDETFHLDVRQDFTCLFSEKLRGPGGLPVGTAGRVLALLSGGIDSPVAAWLLAKRGCRVDFIHFTATSMQQDEARQYKVWRLAQKLGDYTLGSRLFLVPYVYFDLALMRQRTEYDLVLFRRFMLRVAAQLARRLKAKALVTGDNLSQVASQTLSNLVAASRATEMPVFRPLLGYDKEEIMALARRIGTYEDSIEPYKDCCALISRHPRTTSRHEQLAELEAQLFPDAQKLIDQTLAEAICLEARPDRMPAAAVPAEARPAL